MAFEQEGSGGKGNGRDNSICARGLEIVEGDKSDGCRTSVLVYFTCLGLHILLADLRYCTSADKNYN